jgi:hypothetical protein
MVRNFEYANNSTSNFSHHLYQFPSCTCRVISQYLFSQRQPLMPRKQRCLLLLLVLLVAHLFSLPYPYNPHVPILPANSTLDFGTILAVSHAYSQRRASLLWAANLTDLKIVIPPQPEWTEGDLKSFKADKGSSISRGSALAWLGHLNAPRWYGISIFSSSRNEWIRRPDLTIPRLGFWSQSTRQPSSSKTTPTSPYTSGTLKSPPRRRSPTPLQHFCLIQS